MVRRGDYDGLNVFVVEQPAKIAIALGARPASRHAFFQARLINIAHSREVRVLLVPEIVDMLMADQPVADKAYLNAVISAQ